MGNVTIGGKAGFVIGPFTAAGQDTGSVCNSGVLNPAWPTSPLFLPPIPIFPLASGQAAGNQYAPSLRAFTKHNFQLIGSGTGLQITVYFTLDRDTAAGVAAVPQWSPVVAPSDQAGFAWQNPLTQLQPDSNFPLIPVGASLYTQVPAVAFRFVSSLAPGFSSVTGSVSIDYHASS